MYGNGMGFARMGFGFGGLHIWHLIFSVLIFLLVLLLVIWLVRAIFFSGRGSVTARAVLDERLARGDISLREYQQIKKALHK
jgi:uncharacterized membrane protein